MGCPVVHWELWSEDPDRGSVSVPCHPERGSVTTPALSSRPRARWARAEGSVGIFVSAALTIPQIPRLALLARDDMLRRALAQDDSEEGSSICQQ